MVGNITTKNGKKTEALSVFASVFNSQNSYPQGTQPSELEEGDREQNSTSISSGGNSDLLLHLDCHKSMGLDGIHLRVLRELMEVLAKTLSIICQQFWSTGEVLDG